eukprot:c16934_g1_i1.p1 GENE.c16934_g1_i1~~c16934_g1_i1.p1  ORF type:complete len:329 (-),score=126.55 c16934_g1_i1:94-1050(-)
MSKEKQGNMKIQNSIRIPWEMIFFTGSAIRLAHAVYVFICNDWEWPGAGVPEYKGEFQNPKQGAVSFHVATAIIWTIILAYQFYTGLTNKNLNIHRILGWIGLGFAALTSVGGVLSVDFISIPSHVLSFIARQLRHGAPGFFFEAIWGVLAIAKFKDLERHKKHMYLAMFGTFADAGNGFSIWLSRKLSTGTGWEVWAQDFAVLSLNFLAILPWFLPQFSPHVTQVIKRIKLSFSYKNSTWVDIMWDVIGFYTVFVAFLLLMSNLTGVIILLKMNKSQWMFDGNAMANFVKPSFNQSFSPSSSSNCLSQSLWDIEKCF